jgi:hypothetical protein
VLQGGEDTPAAGLLRRFYRHAPWRWTKRPLNARDGFAVSGCETAALLALLLSELRQMRVVKGGR